MKKEKLFLRKGITLIAILALSLVTLTGCQKSEEEQASLTTPEGEETKETAEESAGNETEETETEETETEETETIIVGTGNGYEPYCYLDENGNLAGYEYEVLKAVDELLPQYEFEYQTSDFTNVLIALDAGKIDIAAHQYEYNEERATKYLFGEEPYTTFVTYIVVPKDNSSVTSLDDLQGKTVYAGGKGSNTTYILENYNKEHADNPINIVNAESATSEEFIQSLLSGKWDAAVATKRDVEKHNTAYGEDVIKVVGEPIQSSSTYYIFAKGDEELKDAVEGAIRQLKESGRLSEISIEVIGGDYTESE